MSEEHFQINEAVEEGAPTWIVTFADLMSLLLCFFVLLLSFSEMDRQKYREVAGSMANAFGVQRKEKVFESPKGTKVIARAFERDKLATRDKKEIGKAKEMREAVAEKMKAEIKSRFQDLKDLIEVEVGKHQVVIRMMGEAAFNSGEARIRREMLPLLEKIASILNETKGEIVISGHTDNVPVSGIQFRSNLQLSAERATRVTEFLLSQEPIAPGRISAIGFGKYRPLSSNDQEEGRRRNRRVEIIIKDAAHAE